jgi:hypothetical protein
MVICVLYLRRWDSVYLTLWWVYVIETFQDRFLLWLQKCYCHYALNRVCVLWVLSRRSLLLYLKNISGHIFCCLKQNRDIVFALPFLNLQKSFPWKTAINHVKLRINCVSAMLYIFVLGYYNWFVDKVHICFVERQ